MRRCLGLIQSVQYVAVHVHAFPVTFFKTYHAFHCPRLEGVTSFCGSDRNWAETCRWFEHGQWKRILCSSLLVSHKEITESKESGEKAKHLRRPAPCRTYGIWTHSYSNHGKRKVVLDGGRLCRSYGLHLIVFWCVLVGQDTSTISTSSGIACLDPLDS